MMPAQKFEKICHDLSEIGDSVTISCYKDSVMFSATDGLVSGAIDVKRTASSAVADRNVSIGMDEPLFLSEVYSLEHLIRFTKATPLAAQVKLSLAHHVPLAVEYAITKEHAERSKVVGHIRYLLAPELED